MASGTGPSSSGFLRVVQEPRGGRWQAGLSCFTSCGRAPQGSLHNLPAGPQAASTLPGNPPPLSGAASPAQLESQCLASSITAGLPRGRVHPDSPSLSPALLFLISLIIWAPDKTGPALFLPLAALLRLAAVGLAEALRERPGPALGSWAPLLVLGHRAASLWQESEWSGEDHKDDTAPVQRCLLGK